jgi:chromate reductase
MKKNKIGIVVGSLRKESFCKKVAKLISDKMSDRFEMIPLELDNLQMFNQDFDDEQNTPKEWTKFRQEIESSDGYLFITPEYNRSIPAVIKNALDIASRPFGQNRFNAKPGAIISVSPGQMGAFGASNALRQPLAFLNVILMQQPEAYIGEISSRIDDAGEITDRKFDEFLQKFADAFSQWLSSQIPKNQI